MNFYEQQIVKLKSSLYRQEALQQQIINAKLFIDNHFMENIRLDTIKAEAFLSKFHFLRVFKTSYGKTPHQYLTDLRLTKARQLLKTGMPVTGVCSTVGFESVSSFTRLFKKNTGIPPSVFQKKSKSPKSTSVPPVIFGHWTVG